MFVAAGVVFKTFPGLEHGEGIAYGTGMKISRESPTEEVRYAVRGYGEEGVKINDVVYTTSLILTPKSLDDDWNPPPVMEWQPAELDALLAYDPEILLIGTGARIHILGTAFQAHALRHGVGMEIMDTEAACRTFNVLTSEGRRVVAGLLIEGVRNKE